MKTYEIRSTASARLYIPIFILAIIAIVSSFIRYPWQLPMLMLALIIIVAMVVFTREYYLFGSYRKRTLTLHEHTILLYDREISLDSIKRVVITGYFSPVIALQMKGRKIVRTEHQFKFVNNNDSIAYDEFVAWAKQRQLRIEHGGALGFI